MGTAFHFSRGSYVAVVAQVKVTPAGELAAEKLLFSRPVESSRPGEAPGSGLGYRSSRALEALSRAQVLAFCFLVGFGHLFECFQLFADSAIALG